MMIPNGPVRTVPVFVAICLSCQSVSTSSAQGDCGDALYIHNYPVEDVEAYSPLFAVVEGYRRGPEASSPWPFATGGSVYPTRDFCPLDPDDRIVRLFETGLLESLADPMQVGTLTLVARDLGAVRDALTGIGGGTIRESEFQARRSIYFKDGIGNEFFIWEYPGPPRR